MLLTRGSGGTVPRDGALDAGEARDAVGLAAGPAPAAADPAARAPGRPAGEPRLVVTEGQAAISLLDAVNPLERAAREGDVFARDQGHTSSVAQVTQR